MTTLERELSAGGDPASAWNKLFAQSSAGTAGSGPLVGVRVVEASTLIAAPLAATLLADFGAQVIKIEQPGRGDPLRGYPPFKDGQSLFHKATNRNKLSMALDFHLEEDGEVMRELVAQADVFITNFRLPTLQKWGLDHDQLVGLNPSLVMLHLTAYGRTGPLADHPGFARVAEAFAGLTQISGPRGGEPMFSGYPLGDGLAGYFGAYATMLGLFRQRATGQGELVDLALYEPVMRMMDDLITGYTSTGEIRSATGNDQAYACPSGVYPTSDGRWLVLPASTEAMWQRLAAVMGASDLAGMDLEQRLANRNLVDKRVADFTTDYTLAEIVPLLRERGLACGPVNTAHDIVENEHVAARSNLVTVPDSQLGEVTMQAALPRLVNEPGGVWSPGRPLGCDNQAILEHLLPHRSSEA
ncbi:CaiB/BaiF CoA-transferase family protein [Prescottella sp. R16]|uniref:CaiB/BaiF CoA transferase family protein n=1 Tax=Prescottella sp. R16 TaxID=3064529 RepID=UPI00272E20FD|nr:CoA transferase [Prescottella sp. R16]